jgi:hypothetical protein
MDSGFDNDVNGQGATADLVEQIMRSAELVAEEALTHLDELLPCAAQSGGDAAACGKQFIETFGRRAYRRPLTDEDRQRLGDILAWGLSRGDLAMGVRLVITGMLQSSYFLYRPELGPASPGGKGAAVALTDHELATRLSYLLVESCPDDALLDAADAGQLHTAEQIRMQAERLLGGPAGRRSIDHFFHQWMPFDRLSKAVKSPDQFPQFDDDMKAALAAGIEHVVFDSQKGDLNELLTAGYVFVNAKTAPLYGLEGTFGDAIEQATVTEPRSGLLTQAGMMAALADNYQSSPVARGKFVYQGLLCQSIGAPPANLPAAGVPPKPDPTKTTRERFAEHRTNPVCAGCHNLMDPLGFALENYDAIGAYRAKENGLAIDATGEIPLEGQEVKFDGALELSQYIAKSPLAQTCFARKWFTFAFGRGDVTDDADTIAELEKAFGDGTAPLREVLVAITQTYAFTHRPAADAEECTP